MIKKFLILTASVLLIVSGNLLVYADNENNVLVEGIDYTVEYSDNVKPGTGKATITFMGNYSGQAEQVFNITRKSSGSSGYHSISAVDSLVKDSANDIETEIPTPTKQPTTEHTAYVSGYDDGTFKAEGNMTRSEAAAIFARLIAEAKSEKITGKASFKDVNSDAWHYSYIAYLEKYDILKGYEDKTFKPDAPVTRAEFVAMSIRYYKLFNEVKNAVNTTKYSDVNSSYWAVKDISIATSIGWLNGYIDGTFRGDNSITRAEAVTVINRATNRRADSEYVNKSYTKLNRFTDITDSSQWFFMDVMEAANDHMAVSGSDGENWEK